MKNSTSPALSTTVPPSLTDAIRNHYDHLSEAYEKFWGRHFHHGYWESDETLPQAQVRLVEKLAEHSPIPYGSRVLDVGCGIGGASIWLAHNLGCSVSGITLSHRQVLRARDLAREENLHGLLDFDVQDAAQLDSSFSESQFDVVWVVECSEHLADKSGFIRSCARLLKPGGTLAMASWTAVNGGLAGQQQILEDLSRAMLCPSFGTSEDYLDWIRAAGLRRIEMVDVTPFVERTWDEAIERIQTFEPRMAPWVADKTVQRFLEGFPLMRQAYAEGALGYSFFTGSRGYA